MKRDNLTIGIVGTRGIPASYGGFETFAEELSVRLVNRGISVNVYCDKGSYSHSEYKGVKLVFNDVSKSEHPLLYYSKSIRHSLSQCDIVIVCGNSGSIFFYHRLFISKKSIVVLNTDGVEHKRTKWNSVIRLFLMFVEVIGVGFSDYIIADSIGIKSYLLGKYGNRVGNKIVLLEYGSYLNREIDCSYLNSLNLNQYEYYLIVARLEQENNIHLILDGFCKSNSKKKIVVVGNLIPTKYVQRLLKYQSDDRVMFIGGVYDKHKLKVLRYSCFAYFHGHSVGGTNPSLLEALGSGNIVIAHDNVFNRDVMQGEMFYFKSPADCAEMIEQVEKLTSEEREQLMRFAVDRILNYYEWDLITDRYIRFFENIIDSKSE